MELWTDHHSFEISGQIVQFNAAKNNLRPVALTHYFGQELGAAPAKTDSPAKSLTTG